MRCLLLRFLFASLASALVLTACSGQPLDSGPSTQSNRCAANGGTCITTASSVVCAPSTVVADPALFPCAEHQGPNVQCCMPRAPGSAPGDGGADAVATNPPPPPPPSVCSNPEGTRFVGADGWCGPIPTYPGGKVCGAGCKCSGHGPDRFNPQGVWYCDCPVPRAGTCVPVNCGSIQCELSCRDPAKGICN